MIPDVPRLSRRSVVAVVAVSTVSTMAAGAGCSGGGDGSGSDGAGHASAPPRPGETVRRQAAADSAALLVRYDAVAAAHPALAARLAPLRAEVALHVGAFGGRAAPVPTASPTMSSAASPSAGTPKASATAPATTAAYTPPSSPAAALSALAREERRLADRRAAALLTVPGELARLLASVAAAGAGHATLLTTKGTAR
ncbi:hypothetical protein [Actinacidiphila alni]|uniref:hypothetical protein n=1 Tax=Actinacidiphila alni TaxID=380248 RepID=UPI00345426A6